MLSGLKIGQSLVIAGDGFSFLELAKRYLNSIKLASEAKKSFDALKKENGDFEATEKALTQQQYYENSAKKELDVAWKALKKDKAMQRLVKVANKNDLQEKLLHINLKDLLDETTVPQEGKPTDIPLLVGG